jgi:L-threonylcarbamoyladenylate synthase
MEKSLIPTNDIDHAAEVLSSGGLVAFPTETVYGLGADVRNDTALRRIFSVKQRPVDHPLIVHIAAVDMLTRYASDIPDVAWQLAERFWPGPMTLVLKARSDVSRVVTGGQDTIGLRIPSHPVALSLLTAFGHGIAAPSANRFGRVSPTRASHVVDELGDSIDCVLDGGACEVGLESTIVNLSGAQPGLLRPGAITQTQLEEILGKLPTVPLRKIPRVSGSHASHYSPQTPLSLIDSNQLEQKVEEAARSHTKIALMALRPMPTDSPGHIHWVHMPDNHRDYGRMLFACMRELDESACTHILVEQPPLTAEWAAVNDRLARAASSTQGFETRG